LRRDALIVGVLSVLLGIIGLSIVWSPLSILESSIGVLVRGLGGEEAQRYYTLLSVIRALSIATAIFGGFTIGLTASGRTPKIAKRTVIIFSLLSILILGASFTLQIWEVKIEHKESKGLPFPTSYFHTESLRLQIPEDKYGYFWFKPSEALDRSMVEQAFNQVKSMLPKGAEIISIDEEIDCQVDIWLRRTSIFSWGKPPFEVEIKAGNYSKEYTEVHSISDSTPWINPEETLYVYVYPQTAEDITATFSATYRINPTIHYVYYTIEKPYAGYGLFMMIPGYIMLASLNIALTVFITTQKVCPQCGRPVQRGSKFCPKCGAKLEQ